MKHCLGHIRLPIMSCQGLSAKVEDASHMNPHHDRKVCCIDGPPDIEEKTILAPRSNLIDIAPRYYCSLRVGTLRALRRPFGRICNGRAVRDRQLRSAESQLTQRRSCISNTGDAKSRTGFRLQLMVSLTLSRCPDCS
jgi:hypothetical protein